MSRRLIDFIRVHLSAIGGITPARKLAEVFPGCPELRGGYACLNDRPGLGVDLDEAKAAGYPPCNEQPAWTLARLPDGITAKP